MSLIRQNYSDQSELAVNKTILHASYSYLNVAFFFDRDDIAHPSLHKFFLELSEKKKSQADKTIQKPTLDIWNSIIEALETALGLEKHLNDQFIEELLDVEVSILKELSDLLSQAKRAGSGLGEFLFDKELNS